MNTPGAYEESRVNYIILCLTFTIQYICLYYVKLAEYGVVWINWLRSWANVLVLYWKAAILVSNIHAVLRNDASMTTDTYVIQSFYPRTIGQRSLVSMEDTV